MLLVLECAVPCYATDFDFKPVEFLSFVVPFCTIRFTSQLKTFLPDHERFGNLGVPEGSLRS